MEKNYLFTSESVSEGHPDKICDSISDAILDAFLAQDAESHVAVETLVTTGQVVVAGEVRSKAYVDIQSVVRETIARIGYTKPEYGFEASSCGILTAIHEQSPDINQGVSREEAKSQGAGDQGCIKKGTLITTKRGYVPIEHVVENDYVLTSGGYRRVYHVQKTGELETITLKTNRGNELTLTPDHLVKTEDGWVEAKDTLGKTLSINKEENIKTETHNHVFTLQTQSIAKYKGEHLGIGSVDVELDCNLAYLLGLYMGDGCCNFRVVYFACSLPDKVTKYTEAIKKCGFEPKKTKVGVQVNSVILYQIIEELGLRKKANEKAIPQLIFQSNKDVQSAFVRGCFDSDGSIIIIKREGKSDTFKVKYGTVSKEFAQGLRILLLGLGVNTSVCFSATKGQSHIKQSDGTVIKSNYDIYLVNLRGRDSLIKFSENIGLEVKYKSERLKECLNQTQLVKNINNTETVAEIVKDKVFPVYDISVEGQPEFYANGILVHNCMFGFATDETDTYMPVAHYLATLIVKCLSEIRKEGKLMRYLRPDAKSQVTVEYSPDGIPQRIDTIVVSTQHDEFASEKAMHETILHDVLTTLIPYVKAKIKDERVLALFHNGIKYHVNPTGKFVIGGPAGDTGVTGRKIVVDSYGGYALHGGGAYSSKDPSKVDRSAAYAARYVAKNLVANGLCRQCEIQIGYAIGVAEPVSIYVNDFGTNSGEVEDLGAFVKEHFDLSPYGIDKMLGGLKKPIYKPTAAYGHFGREPYEKDGLQFFPWEKVLPKEELLNRPKY